MNARQRTETVQRRPQSPTVVETQTLATAPYLLRSRRETEELACIAISFKYSEIFPVTKWVDIALVNISGDDILNLAVEGIEASHLWGYVPVLNKPLALATRLRPLEQCLFTVPLTMDFLNVWMTTTFERRGTSRILKLLVEEYPDADDWESHGIYNLLTYHGARVLPSSEYPLSRRTLLHETMKLAAQSPELLHHTSPERFEAIVGTIFEQHGFRVQHVGKSGDGGVDLIAISADEIAPRKLLIQCKLYKGKVGVSPVRELYGVKTDLRATQAILVTTSAYTRAAKVLAEKNCWELSLVDFELLKGLLVDGA